MSDRLTDFKAAACSLCSPRTVKDYFYGAGAAMAGSFIISRDLGSSAIIGLTIATVFTVGDVANRYKALRRQRAQSLDGPV